MQRVQPKAEFAVLPINFKDSSHKSVFPLTALVCPGISLFSNTCTAEASQRLQALEYWDFDKYILWLECPFLFPLFTSAHSLMSEDKYWIPTRLKSEYRRPGLTDMEFAILSYRLSSSQPWAIYLLLQLCHFLEAWLLGETYCSFLCLYIIVVLHSLDSEMFILKSSLFLTFLPTKPRTHWTSNQLELQF